MYILQYLREHRSLEKLLAEHKIYSSRSRDHGSLVCLSYSQIESNLGSPLVQECRGLIVDESDNYNVVARGFDKFFNAEEPNAHEIDWTRARITEKLDGTMIIISMYHGQPIISTTGTADASGPVSDFGFSFAELVRKVLRDTYNTSPEEVMQFETSLIFELTTPFNYQVVRTPSSALTLLAARNLRDFSWLDHRSIANAIGVPYVRTIDLPNNLDQLKSIVHGFNGSECEGVVVDDGVGRIKVKSKDYVLKHKLRSALCSTKSIVQVIAEQEWNEVLATMPELDVVLNPWIDAYNNCMRSAYEAYDRFFYTSQTRKDFALKVKDHKAASLLFGLYDGITAQAAFMKMSIDSKVKLLSEYKRSN